MDCNRSNPSWNWLALIGALAGAAACALMLVAASSASALSGSGSAELRFAQHSKGRTLSGQGVSVTPGAPAQKIGGFVSLPISSLDFGPAPAAGTEASLVFKRGKRSIALTGLRIDLSGGTLNGKLGAADLPVFRLGAAAAVNPVSGKVALSEGSLRLTDAAAKELKRELGLDRALVRKGVGMVWLSAQASPTRVSKPIVSGGTDWGVLASWRKYVLGNFGPGSAGTITTAAGAIAQGTLSGPSGYFAFPAGGGTFEQGLYGATDTLVLHTQGSVTFAKPGHCIVEVELADLEIVLDGTQSSLTLDSVYDIDTPEGKTCNPQPAVATGDVPFASLDPSGVAPTYSADGKTVTWNAIPATLTAAGAAAFGTGYPEGEELDPVTVTVGIG
jgi:hypothetical protein